MSVFLGKWIGYYEDVVPNELCNDIIDYTVESKELSPSKYSTHTGESSRVLRGYIWTMCGFGSVKINIMRK